MTVQISERCSNARLDAIETTMGASPTLRIRSGAPPANTSASRTGTVLATLALPSDFFNDASARAKTLKGTWEDLLADATGTAGHFEFVGTGSVIDMQGTITATGGGGDMEVNNTSFAAGQPFSVTAFQMNDPNG